MEFIENLYISPSLSNPYKDICQIFYTPLDSMVESMNPSFSSSEWNPTTINYRSYHINSICRIQENDIKIVLIDNVLGFNIFSIGFLYMSMSIILNLKE